MSKLAAKIMKEKADNDPMKPGAMKYGPNEAKAIIAEKERELITVQRNFRIKQKGVVLKSLELKEMRAQISAKEEGGVEIKMNWFGMPYPLDILKATYNFEIESFALLTRDAQLLRDELAKKYKLTDEEILGILDGKYVKNLKD